MRSLVLEAAAVAALEATIARLAFSDVRALAFELVGDKFPEHGSIISTSDFGQAKLPNLL